MARLFKGGHERAVQEARSRFEQDVGRFQAHERDRSAALAGAEFRHAQAQESRRQEVDRYNAQVDDLERRVKARTPEAVEDYYELLVEASPLPDDIAVDIELAYQPDARKLLVVRELPPIEIIPETREYTYVKTRDEITAKPRPVKEVRQRYADLVAQLVLRTMRDVFEVRPAELVDEVAVNAHVSTRNRATGRPERPFNALVSPHPWDLEAVRPIFDPDLSKPFEFEVLVKQLFEAMGMKSWVTQASRDDGLDAVAVNEDPIMGGVCVIQAKRYKNTVEPDAVRALAAVMDDKRASRGVLVTTSRFGKASHDFAARHGRIQLIEGSHLKHLLLEYLSLDALLGPTDG
ncbi:restriction endonuclease [Amycolatopsis sp. GM8]|uniref:restriction endonuclease n=1 Tax=Amycolatopsis sp. GM8 TaxID=2896530 RepID=UPI001F3558A9|nr:restriction endonuclease [Amycolatopsis sp. GM8]